MMVGNLSDFNYVYQERLNALVEVFSQRTADVSQAFMMAKSFLYNQLIQQSHLWAYIDTFRVFAVACLIVIPFIVFIKVPKIAK